MGYYMAIKKKPTITHKRYRTNVESKKPETKVHVVWYHLYEVQEQAKLTYCWRTQNCSYFYSKSVACREGWENFLECSTCSKP